MTKELHALVCLVRLTLGRVSAHRQTFLRKYAVKKELKQFCWKSKKDESFTATRKKGLSFGFLVAIIVKDDLLFVFPFPVAVNFYEIHLLIGSQSFVDIAVLLFT